MHVFSPWSAWLVCYCCTIINFSVCSVCCMYWVHQERAELHRTWDLCWVIKPEVENQFVNRFAGLLLLFNVFLKPRTWIFRNFVSVLLLLCCQGTFLMERISGINNTVRGAPAFTWVIQCPCETIITFTIEGYCRYGLFCSSPSLFFFPSNYSLVSHLIILGVV